MPEAKSLDALDSLAGVSEAIRARLAERLSPALQAMREASEHVDPLMDPETHFGFDVDD